VNLKDNLICEKEQESLFREQAEKRSRKTLSVC